MPSSSDVDYKWSSDPPDVKTVQPNSVDLDLYRYE